MSAGSYQEIKDLLRRRDRTTELELQIDVDECECPIQIDTPDFSRGWTCTVVERDKVAWN
jgi:hypothetical protein